MEALTDSFLPYFVEKRIGMETFESSLKNLVIKRLSKALSILIELGGDSGTNQKPIF